MQEQKLLQQASMCIGITDILHIPVLLFDDMRAVSPDSHHANIYLKSTLRVGAALLRGEYEAAVRLIMQPRDGEREETAEARKLYLQKGDCPSAHQTLALNGQTGIFVVSMPSRL